MNACGRHYGMKSNDFYSFLTKDSDEADALKLAREEEQEKIMLSGRKSRRERRAQRERRFAGRPTSPPSYAVSYAAKDDEPTFKEDDDKNDSGESRSSTPENSGKVNRTNISPNYRIHNTFGTYRSPTLPHSVARTSSNHIRRFQSISRTRRTNHRIHAAKCLHKVFPMRTK